MPAATSTEVQKKVDASGVAVGRWDVGLCGCFTHCVPNCLMVWCLPCVSLAQISSRLGVARFGHVLALSLLGVVLLAALGGISSYLVLEHAQEVSETGTTDLSTVQGLSTSVYVVQLLADLVGLCLFVLVWHLRAKTRERFDIPGSCCGDCLAVCCCWACATAQMATHIKSYKPGSCAFGPVDTLPPYSK